MIEFLISNWIKISWLLLVIYIIWTLKKSENGKKWIEEQFNWIKLFFIEDKSPNAPSHKNLIGILLAITFVIAFFKKLVSSTEIPDIASGWQIVLLSLIGIRSAQSAAEKFIDKKFGSNGNNTVDDSKNEQQETKTN